MDSHVVLTVRGTLVPKTLEAARVLHNETAGSEQGMAAARALGDLSHKAFAPALKNKQSTAKEGELLFLDAWVDAKGIMEFFANKHVQEQGGKMFSAREGTVWMAAKGAFSFHLPPAMGKNERFVGMIRGPIKSPEQAIEVFAATQANALRDARKRGQLSHELFIKLGAPGDSSPLELLGIDTWSSFEGMNEHYGDSKHMAPLGAVFAGAPAATVWEQAPGHWNEW